MPARADKIASLIATVTPNRRGFAAHAELTMSTSPPNDRSHTAERLVSDTRFRSRFSPATVVKR